MADPSVDTELSALSGRLYVIATDGKEVGPGSKKQNHVLCCQSIRTFSFLARGSYQPNRPLCLTPSSPQPLFWASPPLLTKALASQKETSGYFKAVTWEGLSGKPVQAAFCRSPNCTSAAKLTPVFSWKTDPCFYHQRPGGATLPLQGAYPWMVIFMRSCSGILFKTTEGNTWYKFPPFTVSASLPFHLAT